MMHKVLTVFVGILCVGIIAFILYPVTTIQRYSAPGSACMSNIKQAITGNLMYSAEHNDRMPICNVWMDATKSYAKNADIYGCPQIKDRAKDEYGHAMNVVTSTVDINKAKNTVSEVCLFDSVLLNWNAHGSFHGYPDSQVDRRMVAYLDGHAGFWKPKKKSDGR